MKDNIEEIVEELMHDAESYLADYSNKMWFKKRVRTTLQTQEKEIEKRLSDMYKQGRFDAEIEIRELVENTENMIAVNDNDGHRYQIPETKNMEWNIFCEIPEDDERSWDVPEWAERIDGLPVSSFKEQILQALKENKDE